MDSAHEFWEWACFTSQQAAEKTLTALLMKRGETARGHASTPMLHYLEDLSVTEALLEQGQLLDAYYIPTRYPNGFPEGKSADYDNRRNSEEAIDAARNVIGFCKIHLAAAE